MITRPRASHIEEVAFRIVNFFQIYIVRLSFDPLLKADMEKILAGNARRLLNLD